MIELISLDRCTGCNICVYVCPINVFDAVPNRPPVIARQDDCQTCFMCELYCPADALYVAPDIDRSQPADETALLEAGLLGGYRAAIGWTKTTRARRRVDTMHQLLSTEISEIAGRSGPSPR